MSGTNTPRPAGQPPKQMSSRLLTMKFMQRAAASAPSQAQSTPTKTFSHDGPSAKRQKLDSPSTPGTPLSPQDSQFADRSAISAALKAEEELRVAARAKSLREGGETEWVLNLPPINGQANGVDLATEDYGEDHREEEIWQPRASGRQTYGSFKRQNTNTTSTMNDQMSATKVRDRDISPASTSDVEEGEEYGEVSSEPSSDDEEHGEEGKAAFSTPASSRRPHATHLSRTNTKLSNSDSIPDSDAAVDRRLDSIDLSRMVSLSGGGGSSSNSKVQKHQTNGGGERRGVQSWKQKQKEGKERKNAREKNNKAQPGRQKSRMAAY